MARMMTLLMTAIFGFWLYAVVGTLLRRSHQVSASELPSPTKTLPRLSVIIPIRNEAQHLEKALQSILQQKGLDYEVVAVNDRSTDETEEILKTLMKEYPQLTVKTVENLPDGWIGKVHALQQGVSHATGSYFLFTDADVIFEEGVLAKTLSYADEQGLDHLTIAPEMLSDGPFQSAFFACFTSLLLILSRAWNINGTRDKNAFLGIGAFNCIRREALEAIGGLEKLKMEVVDDITIGYLIRKQERPQRFLDGTGAISVRYQEGILGLLFGLEKNAFAGAGFKTELAALQVLGLFLLAWTPVLALFFPQSPLQFSLAVAVYFLSSLFFLFHVRWAHFTTAFLQPLTITHMGLTLAYSMYKTLKQKGIYWRDHFYPLEELRRGAVYKR